MRRIVVHIIFLLAFISANAQDWMRDTLQNIRVIARPMPDSIMIRWAPVNFKTWQTGIKYGYTIKRYTLIRDSVLLKDVKEEKLSPTGIKIASEEIWKQIVPQNKYAAIAAQAMFGKTFDVNAAGVNPSSIRNKSLEEQQRYGFSMYAADLSPEVAKACGLMFVDKNVKANEKYLYRVMLNIPTNEKIRKDTGFVFTGIYDYQPLPKPLELNSEFGDKVVLLHWNEFIHNTIFIAYNLERSEDNKNFQRVNKDPIVKIATQNPYGSEYMFANDSFPENGKLYYYRVQGITSFGELSPYSDVTKGIGKETIAESPNIIKQEIIKGKVRLVWDFPKEKENMISGFRILRSDNDKTNFKNIVSKPLKANVREYIDKVPLPTAYYKIEAFKDTLFTKQSFPELVQMTDSIPPVMPKGLVGMMDTSGVIRLSWKRNTEQDIYGYRVFRSVSGKDEFSQRTNKPVADTFYVDTLSRKDLNSDVFYKIVANDQRQNQSEFSEILKIVKPDLIAPAIPVINDIKISEGSIELHWINSNSQDVQKYLIYRKAQTATVWNKIGETEHKKKEQESMFKDSQAGGDSIWEYRLVALDFNGNQSDPVISSPMKGFRSMLKEGIKKISQKSDKEKGLVLLTWELPVKEVRNYIIYRKLNNKGYSMYDTVTGKSSFEDHGLELGDKVGYRIKVIFQDGSVSGFSDEVIIQF